MLVAKASKNLFTTIMLVREPRAGQSLKACILRLYVCLCTLRLVPQTMCHRNIIPYGALLFEQAAEAS